MPIGPMSGSREDADKYTSLEFGERVRLEVSGEASRALSQQHNSGAKTLGVGTLRGIKESS